MANKKKIIKKVMATICMIILNAVITFSICTVAETSDWKSNLKSKGNIILTDKDGNTASFVSSDLKILADRTDYVSQTFESKTNILTEQIDNVSKTVEENTVTIAGIKEELAGLDASVTQLFNEYNVSNNSISKEEFLSSAEFLKIIGDINAKVAMINESITILETNMESKNGEYDSQISEINEKISVINGKLTSLSGLENLSDRLNKIEERLGGLTFTYDSNTDKYGYITKEGDFIPFRNPAGNATEANVLAGVTFANASGDELTGTMKDNRGMVIDIARSDINKETGIIAIDDGKMGYYDESTSLRLASSTAKKKITREEVKAGIDYSNIDLGKYSDIRYLDAEAIYIAGIEAVFGELVPYTVTASASPSLYGGNLSAKCKTTVVNPAREYKTLMIVSTVASRPNACGGTASFGGVTICGRDSENGQNNTTITGKTQYNSKSTDPYKHLVDISDMKWVYIEGLANYTNIAAQGVGNVRVECLMLLDDIDTVAANIGGYYEKYYSQK